MRPRTVIGVFVERGVAAAAEEEAEEEEEEEDEDDKKDDDDDDEDATPHSHPPSVRCESSTSTAKALSSIRAR